MLKIIPLVGVFILSLIFLASFASADYGMMGSSMVSGMYGLGMGFLGLVYFAVFAFVFSLIFWYVYRLIVKKR